MEIILTVLIVSLVGVLVFNLIDLSINGRNVSGRDIVDMPFITLEDTRFEDYLDKKIKWAIEENKSPKWKELFDIRLDILKLAEKLGYYKLEAGEWVKDEESK